MKRYQQLRKKHPKFVFRDFDYELLDGVLSVKYFFQIYPDINLTHEVYINDVYPEKFELLEKSALENLLLNIGLVLIPSYWKATCSPVIEVKPVGLTKWQLRWWYKLYKKGMMQYFLENKIDYTKGDFLTIKSTGKKRNSGRAKVMGGRVLIPIGGGKDSATTLTLLEKFDRGAFVVSPTTKASFEMVKKAGIVPIININNKIDTKLLKLRAKGYLNGHTPYTALLSFLSLLGAYIFGYSRIAFSNERSSNEGNTMHLGEEVNHQYSKTIEFESDFREYNKKHISNIEYFSFLRPLYDIQIAQIFAKQRKYFKIFKSCNVGRRKNIWCCECPKCLSTYILLYPFIDKEGMVDIFSGDLYQDMSLKKLLITLVDKNETKPFECVGTREEIIIGLYLSLKKHEDGNFPQLLQFAKTEFLSSEDGLYERSKRLLKSWDKNHNLPNKYSRRLMVQI